MSLSDVLHDVDRRQQRHRRVSFLAAVAKKFSDDQAGQLAALIAYYGFVSLFPLLLVLVTVLGFVLQGDPDLQQKILDGALGQFPILSDQLKLHSLSGSGVALAIGIIGALLAGLGITSATQNAFNRIWDVPFKRRPNFLHARLRGLAMLGILGAMAIISTLAAGFVGTASHGASAVAGGVLVAFAVNLALFATAFKLLTAADVTWRDLLPGIVVAAVSWQLLQHLLRARARPARLAVLRRAADHLRRRDQRRQSAPAVAAQLLLRAPPAGGQARANRLGRSRGARRAGGRTGQLQAPRIGTLTGTAPASAATHP